MDASTLTSTLRAKRSMLADLLEKRTAQLGVTDARGHLLHACDPPRANRVRLHGAPVGLERGDGDEKDLALAFLDRSPRVAQCERSLRMIQRVDAIAAAQERTRP